VRDASYARRRHRLVRGGLALALLAPVPGAAAQTGLTLGEALRDALRMNPNISLQQQQVRVNRGFELQALGQFDPLVSGVVTRNRDPRPLRRDEIAAFGTNTQVSNTIGYSVGVQQPLRTGLTLGASVDVSTVSDNVLQSGGIPPQTAGRVSFTVRAPLLRNAGTEATTANLSAAEAEVTAAQYDLVFTNAQTLLNTTFAYWDYLARLRRLDIARDAETRSLRIADETRRLITADELPAAEIQLVLASASERAGTRVSAEQAVAEARRNLAVQIGLPVERLAALPPPADDFPPHEPRPIALDTRIDDLLDIAYTRRADFEAAKHRERAARHRLTLARSGLKPQVDVTLGAGYGTLVENRAPFDLYGVLGHNRAGPTLFATLAAEIPVRNSAAEGFFLAQSALLSASHIRVKNVADTIGNNVLTDVQALVRSAEQLAQSVETTRYYARTLENERTKRRLGLATLIDVINVEDRLTNALLAEVAARQTYANAIAQLRFDLGTIVLERDGQFDVAVEDLLKPTFDTRP
jgi:outer membrane protein TolC